MCGRLIQLAALAVVAILLCLSGWLLLRATGADSGGVPPPITVPARESVPTSSPPADSPSSTSPSPTSASPPPAPEPTDVVAPPPAVDDDDDDGGDDDDD